MSIHTLTKTAALENASKQPFTNPLTNKKSVKPQPHKVSHLYETPFSDVVTNEYVRGYN